MPLTRSWLILWSATLIAAWTIYSLGLPGSFIFDDAPNLNALAAIHEGTPEEIAAFSLQGFAGPSGRPLSLLTFALQHESWPTDPAAFKKVNILLHLLNGTLVLALFLAIGKARGTDPAKSHWIAVVAATVWLLWPIHVSSVLYVVQRMTLLSATCMLIGLLLYVHARMLGTEPRARWPSYLMFGLAMTVGLGLGVLCKENAAVFPLLLLAMNSTILASMPRQPLLWRLGMWLPVGLLVIYLMLSPNAFAGYQIREFNLPERLMTETRAIWVYVHQIITPSAGKLRFLYDNYPISKSLFTPPQTVIAILGLAVAAAFAWRSRTSKPLLASAVLFFLASHALESTILPLELVFEHRNYLGSAAISYAMTTALLSSPRISRTLSGAAAAGYIAAICVVLISLTSLWGKPLEQRYFWLAMNPDSPRVHLDLAGQLLLQGHAEAAEKQLEAAAKLFPQDMSFPVARLELACYHPEFKGETTQAAARLSNGSQGMLPAVTYLDRMVAASGEQACPSYSPGEILSLIEAAHRNPVFLSRKQDLFVLQGIVQNLQGNTADARASLEKALNLNPKPDLLVQAATWEASNQNYELARKHLDSLLQLQQSAPLRYLALKVEIERLKVVINASDVPSK